MAPTKATMAKVAARKQPARVARNKPLSQPMQSHFSGNEKVRKSISKRSTTKKSPSVSVKKNYSPKLIQSITDAVVDLEDDSPKFTCFGKLPLEIRLKVWSNAAPEPYIVVQRSYQNTKHRFSYNRPVPAVLHTCRESRTEFLDSGDESTDTTLARRRRDHPVYKLSFFQNRLRSSPIFFSADVDSFWGTRYSTKYKRSYSRVWSETYSGIASLDIARDLKHLILEPRSEICRANDLNKMFPKLEQLTLLLPLLEFLRDDVRVTPSVFVMDNAYVTLTPGPEIQGEVDTASFSPANKILYERFRAKLEAKLIEGKDELPNWTAPVLKIRIKTQLMENEGITSEAGIQKEEPEPSDSDLFGE